MSTSEASELLTTPEVARRLGLEEGWRVYELIEAGDLEVVRTERGQHRAPASSVEGYLSRARR